MSGKHFTKYIGLLLLVVVMALASTQVFAVAGGGNESCPAGTIQIAKFNWSGNAYAPEGDTNGVSVSGDNISGTFNSSTYPIAAVVVKGSTDAKIDPYNPAVMSGSFNNSGLSTPNGNNTPEISNIKFCKPEVTEEEPTPIQDLQLTSMCSDDPSTSLNWRVSNPNNFPVDVTWEIYPNQATGTLVAQPGDTFFSTNRVAGDNTVKIYWLDENESTQSTTKASGYAQCQPPVKVCEPNWQADLKHNLSYIVDVNGTTATATITNKSELCEYPVGFASYEKFDEVIDNQSLFDSSTTVIKPGETITLTVNLPLCATQIDLFYGDLITSFAGGVRYGQRLLDARHLGGTEYCDLCTDPDPARDLKHIESRLISDDTGRIVNLSETCSYEVGIASYKRFDDVIDNQHLFDFVDTVIEPGETLELNVKLPQCAAQVDLFYGHHLESLFQQRYGTRLLDARYVGGSNFCEQEALVCSPDRLGAMTLNASTASDKLFVQASFASGTPTHVVFQLGSITWTELYNPYIFMGDAGWDISAYAGEATNIAVKAYSGEFMCQTGSIDIVQYLPVTDPEEPTDPEAPNQPPVVILPGQNVEITGVTRSGAAIVTLDASKSYDPEGKPISYLWHNNETAAIQQVRLGKGMHEVWVTVTDADGQSSTGMAIITVKDPNENVAPVAVIEGEAELTVGIDGKVTFTLSGASSFDSDGDIAGYMWSNSEITDSITLTLGEGLYTYTLTVTDDDGATNMTFFNITVLASGDSTTTGPTDPSENGKVTPGGGNNNVPIEPPVDEASM